MKNEAIIQEYPFTTLMPVRITDINYGMHLGHMAMVGIFHHARVLFLKDNRIDELNIEGAGLILVNSQYCYKVETSFNTNLKICVGVRRLSKLKINFIYKAINDDTGVEIANGIEDFTCINYKTKKVVRIPSSMLSFCEKYSK